MLIDAFTLVCIAALLLWVTVAIVLPVVLLGLAWYVVASVMGYPRRRLPRGHLPHPPAINVVHSDRTIRDGHGREIRKAEPIVCDGFCSPDNPCPSDIRQTTRRHP